MDLTQTLSRILPGSSEGQRKAQYECNRCGERYLRPATPCEECGSDVMKPLD